MAQFLILTTALLFILSTLIFAQNADNSVLIFTKTEGWRHASIETGMKAVKQLGRDNNFKYFFDATNKLLKLDTDSHRGSEHPGNHAVSWHHEYDGRRAFYTALDHTSESFSEETYLQHILGGIRYAMGVADAN